MQYSQRSHPFSILFLGLTMAAASGLFQATDASATPGGRQVIQQDTVAQCQVKRGPGGCIPKPWDIKKPPTRPGQPTNKP